MKVNGRLVGAGAQGWLLGDGGVSKRSARRRSARLRGLACVALMVGGAGLATAQSTVLSPVPVYVLPGDPTVVSGTGRSLSSGDVTGDGYPDIIASGWGRVRVFSGKTGEVWLTLESDPLSGSFGHSVASAGDVNGDGHEDIVVGAPEMGTTWKQGRVFVFSGKDGTLLYQHEGTDSVEELGLSVAGGMDLDGDGVPDYVAGGSEVIRAFSGADGGALWIRTDIAAGSLCMLADTNGDGSAEVVRGVPGGYVDLLSGPDGSTIFQIANPDGTGFGRTVARVGDIDGDGVEDFAVGAPNGSTGPAANGRVEVFSGADGSLLLTLHGIYMSGGLGWSLAGAGDVDGDGVPDIIAGAPGGYTTSTAHVFSGATGAMLYELWGLNYSTWTTPKFGYAVTGLGDLNGDGLSDFAVGYMGDHTFGDYAGSVYVYLAGSTDPEPYCESKPNSQGCLPEISSSGLASLSVGSFELRASNVVNQQPGILAWSLGAWSQPFFGGTLCLRPPIVRTAVQGSGGNPGPADCSGTYSFPFGPAYIAERGLAPGTTVHAQFWQRDPSHPDGTGVGLTAALAFTIHP